jgi:UDP-N-acetylmuramoylalanine--D-glutamate ligase
MTASARLEDLAGCRVGIVGFGREGRSAVRALTARVPSAQLTVFDERGPVDSDLPVVVGPFDQRLRDFDALIRSPGVQVRHPALESARAAGVEVLNPVGLWLAERSAGTTVIGVTGSKGKSTTVSLLAHLLEKTGREVLLAGNIGVPVLDHLDTPAEIAVLELSSYQLSDLTGSIHLGVFTRLFPEHLDWHGGKAHYYASKLRLADCLEGRSLIVNAQDGELMDATRGVSGRVAGNRPPCAYRDGDALIRDGNRLCGIGDLPLVGRHNLDNAALALEAALAFGGGIDRLVGALKAFEPLPHRLEPVATIADVRYINDTIATSPHATLAALESVRPAPTLLIVGGQDRPADWAPVIDWCRRHGLVALITLPDNGAGIASAFRAELGADAPPLVASDNLDQALRRAAEMTGPGDTVLLSPGAPSFPRFRDFEQRGESFRRAVARLDPGPVS